MNPKPQWIQIAREAIWRRDDWRCVYCGVALAKGNRSVDHIVPVPLGGPSEPWNLVAACLRCNQRKPHGHMPDEARFIRVAASRPIDWHPAYTEAFDRAIRYADYRFGERWPRCPVTVGHEMG